MRKHHSSRHYSRRFDRARNLQPALPEEWRLFPYQSLKQFQVQAIRAIQRHNRVMLQAPTGFGKTIVALVALLPLIKKENQQLIIFTRTKAQIYQAIFRELSLLAKKQVYGYLTAVPIVTKKDLCVLVDQGKKFYPQICNECPLYRKTTMGIEEEELPIILEQLPLWKGQGLAPSMIKDALQEIGCPYFLTRRGAKHADVIVATHSYLLNRTLRSYFLETILNGTTKGKAVLVDEAHDFSPHVEAELSMTTVNRAKKVVQLKIFDQLLELMSRKHGVVERVNFNTVILEEFMQSNRKLTPSQVLVLQAVLKFLTSQGDAWISQDGTLYQVTPFVDEIFHFLSNFERTVLISGTFMPLRLHATLYGTTNYHQVEIPTEFRKQYVGILQHPLFTSKHEKRSYKTFRAQVELIHQLHEVNPHHTLIVTPSYEYMNHLMNHGLQADVIEPRQGSAPLDEISFRHDDSLRIMGVMGGKITEGVELIHPDTRQSLLTLVIITGLAYPVPDTIHEYLMRTYSQKYGPKMAKDMLLQLPMIKMLYQAIGRGIRRPQDYSAAVILDYRVALLKHFPGTVYKNPAALLTDVREFLEEHHHLEQSRHHSQKQIDDTNHDASMT